MHVGPRLGAGDNPAPGLKPGKEVAAVRGYWKSGAHLGAVLAWLALLVGVLLAGTWLFLQVGGWLR
jgi:hypothetical protein